MPVGTVKWFCRERGFGYIAPEMQGLDIYVGPAAMKAAGLEVLEAGQSLRYETVPNNNGRPAASSIATELTPVEMSRARRLGQSLLALLKDDHQAPLIATPAFGER